MRTAQGTLVLETSGVLGTANNLIAGTTNFSGGNVARPDGLSSAGIYSPFIVQQDASGLGDFVEDAGVGGLRKYSGSYSTDINALSGPLVIGNFTGTTAISGNATKSLFALKTTGDVTGGRILMSSLANTNGKSEVGGILINGANVTISSNLYFDSGPSGIAATSPNGTSGEGIFYVAPGMQGTLTGSLFARGLTKFGSGTLVFDGANEILGNLTVQGGTLKIGSGARPTTFATPLAVNSNGVLDLNGLSYAFDSLGTTGGAAGGVITGATNSELIINGLGNPTLLATHTGSITTGTAALTVDSTSDLFVGMPVSGAGVAAGTLITAINSATSVTLSANTSGTTGTSFSFGSIYEGQIKGEVRLTKIGLGTLTLGSYNTTNPDAGSNSYTGGTEIQGGVLTILNPLNLPATLGPRRAVRSKPSHLSPG